MKLKRPVVFALVVVAAATAWLFEQGVIGGSARAGADLTDGAQSLQYAFDKKLNDEWIEATARVTRLLSDDQEGSAHQRFIVKAGAGQSLLIAHNIDLAPRVPVAIGDRVRFRGVYEWNERGGVIHWTHHDPQGGSQGGYIEHQRKKYR